MFGLEGQYECCSERIGGEVIFLARFDAHFFDRFVYVFWAGTDVGVVCFFHMRFSCHLLMQEQLFVKSCICFV